MFLITDKVLLQHWKQIILQCTQRAAGYLKEYGIGHVVPSMLALKKEEEHCGDGG